MKSTSCHYVHILIHSFKDYVLGTTVCQSSVQPSRLLASSNGATLMVWWCVQALCVRELNVRAGNVDEQMGKAQPAPGTARGLCAGSGHPSHFMGSSIRVDRHVLSADHLFWPLSDLCFISLNGGAFNNLKLLTLSFAKFPCEHTGSTIKYIDSETKERGRTCSFHWYLMWSFGKYMLCLNAQHRSFHHLRHRSIGFLFFLFVPLLPERERQDS